MRNKYPTHTQTLTTQRTRLNWKNPDIDTLTYESLHLSIYLSIYLSQDSNLSIHTNTNTDLFKCLSFSTYLCVRERERERHTHTKREREKRERERERERVCVCVCVCVRESDRQTDRYRVRPWEIVNKQSIYHGI